MSTKRCYYEVMGVARDTNADELKKVYRKLAMKYHPDRHQGAEKSAIEEQFKEIKEAYEALSDAKKRSIYDQYGHAGLENGGGGGGHGFSGSSFADAFGDVFGDIFGGGRAREQRGADLGYQLVLTLEEAALGCEKEIHVPKHVSCGTCQGSGAKQGSTPINCHTCDGYGQVRMQQGFFSVQQACPTCMGQGKVIKDKCNKCHGQGVVKESKTLSVKMPAGVDNGDRVRLNGEGEAGMNRAPAGDLYVQVKLKPHDLFERDGADLYCDVPISFQLAALGGELQIPALDGWVNLKIPAETQTGKVFRVRGKGLKRLQQSGTGDLLCRIVLETPVGLSKKQQALLQEFSATCEASAIKHTPKQTRWFERVKAFVGTIR